jgi:hypothetical protein
MFAVAAAEWVDAQNSTQRVTQAMHVSAADILAAALLTFQRRRFQSRAGSLSATGERQEAA